MKCLHIITPVKDSIDSTLETVKAIMESDILVPFTYTVYNDFSTEENTHRLEEAARQWNFRLVNLSDLTDHPSPNYLLVLQTAQKEAIEADAGLLGLNPEIILDFFPYSGEEAARQSLNVSLGYIAKMPLNFSLLDVHMWYIYLLIGLYLYLPIFSAWVEKVSEKAKLWFLVAWGITGLLPYYYQFVSPYIWGGCAWNSFNMLYYFAGFNGYLLLGHYLRNHDWSWSKTLSVCIPMFLAGYMVTFFGFRHMTALPQCTDEMLELFFTYNSLNVIMMTIPFFLIAKKVKVRSELIQRMLANLTVCGFGIYMIHYFFTGPGVVLMRNIGVPVPLQIPAAAIVAFGVSWLLVVFIRKISGKNAKYIVG